MANISSLLAKAKQERMSALNSQRKIYETAEAEGRKQLTAAEAAELAKLREAASKAKATIEQLRGIAAEEADAMADASTPDPNGRVAQLPKYDEVARVTSEPAVYRQQGQRGITGRAEPTWLQDLYAAQVKHDPAAMGRLDRHGQMIEDADQHSINNLRAIGSGAVSGFVPPQYLDTLFAEYARAGRPSANLCARAPLPAEGMTLNIPRVTTSTAVAVQATEGGAIGNQDPDDTLLSVPVVTVAGYVDLSRQALERGALVESIVFGDLAADYNAKLDLQVLNGTGSNGQHLGILNVGSINAITYTDASPTVPEMWPKLADMCGKVVSGRFTGPTAIVMRPNLWAWMLSEKDTTGRPLIEPEQVAVNPTAVQNGMAYSGVAGYLFGVPVILDGNMPANLGTGTNETRVIAADFRDILLFEDGGAPAQMRFDDVLSSTLQVRLLVYGYSALASGRQPSAISVVSGTGLIVPAL